MTARRDVPLALPALGRRELDAVNAVFASGWVAGQGPSTRAFEEAFARRIGVAHAIAVNNCTAALHLCLLALGVGPGDEVLVADYTFPATGHAVLYCGARPRFVDVRADTATVALDALAAAPPTAKGVVVVDALGQVADYDGIDALARERGWFVLEDAACAAGARYRGRAAGTFGDAACFSLHGRKGITCGEGGVITTDDPELAARVRKRSCFGMASAFDRQRESGLPIPVFDELGYNYKLADILSAIAHVQLDRIDELLAGRRGAAAAYRARLAGQPLIALPAEPDDREHVFQTYAITVDPTLDRNRIAAELRARGVGCNIGTYASHLQPVYRAGGATVDVCPTSAALFEHHLALPMHSALTEDDVDYVAAALLDVIERERKEAVS